MLHELLAPGRLLEEAYLELTHDAVEYRSDGSDAPGCSHDGDQRRGLGAEWTKVRSVRSTPWTLLAAVVMTLGIRPSPAPSTWRSSPTSARPDKADLDPASLSLTGGILAQLAIRGPRDPR